MPDLLLNESNSSQANNYFSMELARSYWSSEEKVKGYVSTFIDQYGDLLQSLHGDSADLSFELVHKIKGASSVLGMPMLTETLSHLEGHLRNEKALNKEQLSQLKSVWIETHRVAKHPAELSQSKLCG